MWIGDIMAMQAAIGMKTIPDALNAAKRFGGYKDEKEKGVRCATVENDKTLERIRGAWSGYEFNYPHHFPIFRMYEDALKALGGISCSPEDVERFSVIMAGFQGERHFSAKAGLFLSALINSAAGDGFRIHTEILSEPPAWLGVLNQKSVITIGRPNDSWQSRWCGFYHSVGFHASAGAIFIDGGVDEVGHYMSGGRIIVNGPACSEIGYKMTGGTIGIFGDVDGRISEVAGGMIGGEIRIYGNFDEAALEGPIHGRIYHRGKLIVGK